MTGEQIITKLVEQAESKDKDVLKKLVSSKLRADNTKATMTFPVNKIEIVGRDISNNYIRFNWKMTGEFFGVRLSDDIHTEHFSFADIWTNHDFMKAACGGLDRCIIINDIPSDSFRDKCELTNNGKCICVYIRSSHKYHISQLAKLSTPADCLAYIEKSLEKS